MLHKKKNKKKKYIVYKDQKYKIKFTAFNNEIYKKLTDIINYLIKKKKNNKTKNKKSINNNFIKPTTTVTHLSNE